MSKGLYHCSKCKQHFYDHEATAMHIRDKHKGDGEVLRHPTKRELLIRDQQQADRIEALEAEKDAAVAAALVRAEELASIHSDWAADEIEHYRRETQKDAQAELEARDKRVRNEALREAAELAKYEGDEFAGMREGVMFDRLSKKIRALITEGHSDE